MKGGRVWVGDGYWRAWKAGCISLRIITELPPDLSLPRFLSWPDANTGTDSHSWSLSWRMQSRRRRLFGLTQYEGGGQIKASVNSVSIAGVMSDIHTTKASRTDPKTLTAYLSQYNPDPSKWIQGQTSTEPAMKAQNSAVHFVVFYTWLETSYLHWCNRCRTE
jgi:hypothetical protein